MNHFTILLLILIFSQIITTSQNNWIEIDETTQITYHSTLGTQYTDADCYLFYEQLSTSADIKYEITLTEGYSALKFSFNTYLKSAASGTLYIKDLTTSKTLYSESISVSNAFTQCNSQQTQYQQIIIDEDFSSQTQYLTLNIQIYFSTNSLYVDGFKVFYFSCTSHCLVCSNDSQCQTCQTNFILQDGNCLCQHYYYQGNCLLACPTGMMYYNKECKSYTSSLDIFQDLSGINYSFLNDYNTTQRSISTSINGNIVGGTFIQNEKIYYNINYPITTSSDFYVSFSLYLIGDISLFTEIEFQINNYQYCSLLKYDSYNAKKCDRISQSTCVMTGITNCQQINIEFNIFNIDVFETFSIQGRMNLTDQTQLWAFNNLIIKKIEWTPSTICTLYYQDECVSSCPKFTTYDSITSTCIQYGSSYKFSEVLAKLFYDNVNFFIPYNLKNQPDLFLSTFQNQFVYGGMPHWKQSEVNLLLNTNSPHYKAKLFVNILLIDFPTGNLFNFTTYFGSQYIVTKTNSLTATSTKVGQHLIDDFLIQLQDIEISHNDQLIELVFNCNTDGTAYCAIYDLYVVIALCPINCYKCSNDSSCDEIQQIFFESTLNPIVYYDCPDGYYYFYGTCNQCKMGCKSCTNEQSCDVCSTDYIKFSDQCFCSNSLASNIQCKETCQLTINIKHESIVQCPSCSNSQHKVRNIDSCKCQDGYFMNQNFSCEKCYETCVTCQNDARTCTSCSLLQFRILDTTLCLCQDGYFDDDDGNCLQCLNKCQRCQYYDYNCTQCFLTQYRVLDDYDCVCQQGYYEQNSNLICQKCNDLCEYCSSVDVCTSCYDTQYRTLNTNTCICQQGYYDSGNLICEACYYTCSKCQDSNLYNQCTQCPSTRISSNQYLQEFECLCKTGYYDDGNQQCQSCLNYINPPSTHYCYSNCGDQIIQWNEQCDDGNTEPRDGCDECYFSNSTCLSDVCLTCYIGNCIKCSDGYYLDSDYACQQCSQICVTCINNSTNCLTCTYKDSDGNCIDCQEVNGYTIIDNECVSVCGDGIITSTEQCDDGNIIDGDGCDQYCQVEDGYICNPQCVKINYVEILLSEDVFDQLYENIRTIYFTFNQQVNLTYDSMIKDYITIESNQSNFSIISTQIQDKSDYNSNYNTINLVITIQVNQSYSQSSITVSLSDSIQVYQIDNFTLKNRTASLQLIDCYLPSDAIKNVTKGLVTFGSYILYLMIGFFVLAFILGGLDIFWNLLDTLQMLSYLKYFNVAYPYNVSAYFELFGFAEFDFLKSNINLEDFISQYVDSPDSPYKFQQEGYSTLFIVNVIAILIVFLTTIGTYIAFHLIYFLLYKYAASIMKKDYIETTYEEHNSNVCTYLCYKLLRYSENYFFKMKIEYKTGILRSFLTISYDLNLAIFLQLKSFVFNKVILLFSGILASICLGIEITLMYFGIIVMSRKRYYFDLEETQLTYNALYEGIKMSKSRLCYYYNIIIFTKKMLFMLFLVILYYFPCYQIGFTSLLSLIFCIYLLYVQPLETNEEFFKQFSSELILFIIQLLALFIGFNEQSDYINYQQYDKIGWALIALMTLIIVIQMLIDIKLHISFIIKNYKIIKLIIKKFKDLKDQLFGQKKLEFINDDTMFLVDSSSQSLMKKEKSSKTYFSNQNQKKLKKIVTFTM